MIIPNNCANAVANSLKIQQNQNEELLQLQRENICKELWPMDDSKDLQVRLDWLFDLFDRKRS